MSRRSSACVKLAILMLTAAALAGCGRKGPLELPPSAAAQPAGARSDVAPRGDVAANSAPGIGRSDALFATGDEPDPVAARGRKKSFFLDFLLE